MERDVEERVQKLIKVLLKAKKLELNIGEIRIENKVVILYFKHNRHKSFLNYDECFEYIKKESEFQLKEEQKFREIYKCESQLKDYISILNSRKNQGK